MSVFNTCNRLVETGQMTNAEARQIMSYIHYRNTKENEMNDQEIKPGWKTSELWLAVVASILCLLIAYNILTADTAEAWQAVFAAIIPLALSIVSSAYSNSRARVKSNSAEK